jgi:hypothetical protein
MTQLFLNLDVSRRDLVYKYIQILTKLRHPLLDGESRYIFLKGCLSDLLFRR